MPPRAALGGRPVEVHSAPASARTNDRRGCPRRRVVDLGSCALMPAAHSAHAFMSARASRWVCHAPCAAASSTSTSPSAETRFEEFAWRARHVGSALLGAHLTSSPWRRDARGLSNAGAARSGAVSPESPQIHQRRRPKETVLQSLAMRASARRELADFSNPSRCKSLGVSLATRSTQWRRSQV